MRKKSKYKPKPVMIDNMSYVKSGLIMVANVPKAGVELELKGHEAFDEILKGNPTTAHVDDLIALVNVTEALAILRLGHDWLPEIYQANRAVRDMAARGISGKGFRFTGEEMEIVKTILALHSEQLKNCPVKKMEEALFLVEKNIRAGKAEPIKPLEMA